MAKRYTKFGVEIDVTPNTPTQETYDSIREMAKAHLKHLAEIHRVDEATVTDAISGKKINLKKRRKELEEAGNE